MERTKFELFENVSLFFNPETGILKKVNKITPVCEYIVLGRVLGLKVKLRDADSTIGLTYPHTFCADIEVRGCRGQGTFIGQFTVTKTVHSSWESFQALATLLGQFFDLEGGITLSDERL